MTRWRYAAATDTGLVRETNQDAYFVDDAVAIVADGMGGHAAGEVASAMTVDKVYNGFLQRPTVEGVVQAIGAANRDVLANAKEHPERQGMGTTLIAVGLLDEPGGHTVPVLFHVGDSRAYQLRDGALRQLSEDHSVAEEWVRMGRLTPEEALIHPRRHQLTRAIGVDQPLEIDVQTLSVQVGDRLLLCSDGLSNELSPEDIAEIASAPGDLESAVHALVQAATYAGGRDNISAVLVEFVEAHEPSLMVNQVMLPPPPTPPRAEPVASPLSKRRPKRRVFTWRNGAVVAILGALVWGFFAIMHWYAYSNFFLADNAGRVVIYQGQPNGVLWYKPHLVHVTRFTMKELRGADRAAITATVGEPSLRASLQYITYLHAQWQLSLPTTTTTTTTTSTTTTSTTTTLKAKK